jgi:hypothetical protein
LTGVWFTWPFSDFMDIIVCAIFIILEMRIINRAMKSQEVKELQSVNL